MDSTIEIDWYYTTSWDQIGFGKINIKYIIK